LARDNITSPMIRADFVLPNVALFHQESNDPPRITPATFFTSGQRPPH